MLVFMLLCVFLALTLPLSTLSLNQPSSVSYWSFAFLRSIFKLLPSVPKSLIFSEAFCFLFLKQCQNEQLKNVQITSYRIFNFLKIISPTCKKTHISGCESVTQHIFRVIFECYKNSRVVTQISFRNSIPNKQRYGPAACEKCIIQGPTPDIPNQNLNFNWIVLHKHITF